MLPQINPYYFQQPMYQNPIYQQTTMPQQNVSTMQMNGRLIDNIDSVSANEVSMTGISVFPKNDMSEVYIKSWNNDGTIKTLRFMPYNAPQNKSMDILSTDTLDVSRNASDEVTEGIMKRLDTIESKLDAFLKPTKAKKEVQNE